MVQPTVCKAAGLEGKPHLQKASTFTNVNIRNEAVRLDRNMHKASPGNPGCTRHRAGLRAWPRTREGSPGKPGVKALCSQGLRPEPKLGFILEKNPRISRLLLLEQRGLKKQSTSASQTRAQGKSIVCSLGDIQSSEKTQGVSHMFRRNGDVMVITFL